MTDMNLPRSCCAGVYDPDQNQQLDIRVFPYNADTKEEIARVLSMEVDGVISSDPFLPN